MTDKITRRQAWMKLAVLIADGLPDPKQIDFHADGEGIYFQLSTHAALTAWAEHFAMREYAPNRTEDGTWIHSASSHSAHSAEMSNWHGWHVSLTAYVRGDPEPEEATDDLTAVRELAADHDGPVDGCECEELAASGG